MSSKKGNGNASNKSKPKKNTKQQQDKKQPDTYKHITKDMVAAAASIHRGNKSEMAKTLNCSRRSIYNFIERWPEVEQAFKDVIDERVEKAQVVIDSALAGQLKGLSPNQRVKLAVEIQYATGEWKRSSKLLVERDRPMTEEEMLNELAGLGINK